MFKILEESVQTEEKQLNIEESTEQPTEPPKKPIRTIETLIWVVLGLLAALLIISCVVLILRLADYAKVDEREVKLTTNMDESFDVFSVEYESEAGDVTIKGAEGEKVLAPGAEVEYTLRFRNSDNVAIDYQLVPQVSFLSDIAIPIEVRLIGPDHEYLAGSPTEWVDMSELNDVTCNQTLLPSQSVEYYFQWKWPFESGNDEYDSWLGSNVGDMDVGAELSFGVHSVSNTDAKLNGGIFGYQTPDVIYLFVIMALLIAAVTLLVIHVVKKYKAASPKEEENEEENAEENISENEN